MKTGFGMDKEGRCLTGSNFIKPKLKKPQNKLPDKDGLSDRARRKIEEVKQDASGHSLKPENCKEVWDE